MDDATVEDENDDIFVENNENNRFPPRNQDPAFFSTGFNIVTTFLQSYGWLILIALLCVLYFKDKFLKFIQNLQHQRNENISIDLHRYDESDVQRRHEAMDDARKRMQERYAQEAERFKEEQAKKEEEKRKERLEDWERHQEGKGYRSKHRNLDEPSSQQQPPPTKPTSQEKKKVYRPDDYNPLMGSSGGGCYRPTQRRGGGGGG